MRQRHANTGRSPEVHRRKQDKRKTGTQTETKRQNMHTRQAPTVIFRRTDKQLQAVTNKGQDHTTGGRKQRDRLSVTDTRTEWHILRGTHRGRRTRVKTNKQKTHTVTPCKRALTDGTYTKRRERWKQVHRASTVSNIHIDIQAKYNSHQMLTERRTNWHKADRHSSRKSANMFKFFSKRTTNGSTDRWRKENRQTGNRPKSFGSPIATCPA